MFRPSSPERPDFFDISQFLFQPDAADENDRVFAYAQVYRPRKGSELMGRCCARSACCTVAISTHCVPSAKTMRNSSCWRPTTGSMRKFTLLRSRKSTLLISCSSRAIVSRTIRFMAICGWP